MADVFISYSKQDPEPTAALAKDLEAQGWSTWWDTSLLPGDEFPEVIKHQIEIAKAVIVIWTTNSVKSQWVRAEAMLGHSQGKLITLFAAGLDVTKIPLPFTTLHREPVANREKIYATLQHRGVRPMLAVRRDGRPRLHAEAANAPAIISFRYMGTDEIVREFVEINIEGIVNYKFYLPHREVKMLQTPAGFYNISAKFTEYVTREVYTNGVVIKSEGSIDGQSDTLRIVLESGRSYSFSCDLSTGFGNWISRNIRRRQGISLTLIESA